jgi:hypothetical protein
MGDYTINGRVLRLLISFFVKLATHVFDSLTLLNNATKNPSVS